MMSSSPRQPIFNVPPAVEALCVILIFIQCASLCLPDTTHDRLVTDFAFIPARYFLVAQFGLVALDWQSILSPITYMFLHGGWIHLGVNVISLAAFGSPVERDFGKRFFCLVFLLCGIAGAFAEFLMAPESEMPLIGASAGISGLFAVAFRILGQQRASKNPLGVIVVLVIIMAVTGVIGMPGVSAPIAWVAHIGGFIAGLILYELLTGRSSRAKRRANGR